MDIQSEIINRIVKQVNSKNASTFFLNGPPGSGKTHFLNNLVTQLPNHFVRACVCGPYTIHTDHMADTGHQLAEDMHKYGFTEDPKLPQDVNLTDAWNWINTHGHFPSNQVILVILDLPNCWDNGYESLGNLLSSARYLEGAWKNREPRISHVFSGFWDHTHLERYYDQIQTSFPYTVGYNYGIWTGVEEAETINLVSRVRPHNNNEIRGRVLHELTGGHPAITMEILKLSQSSEFTLQTVLTATRSVAQSGAISATLVRVWKQLSSQSKDVLRKLLVTRQVATSVSRTTVEQLTVAGLIRVKQIGSLQYITFHSWFVELVARLHANEIDIASEQTERIPLADLIPSVSTLNREAYQTINDIENSMRNFLTGRLNANLTSGIHILVDECKRYDDVTGTFQDAYTRAMDWRARNEKRGLAVNLNPLIAYCSIRDLAAMTQKIASDSHSQLYKVGKSLDEIGDIRDAVMHNQLIEFDALEKLGDLQRDIYNVLGKQ